MKLHNHDAADVDRAGPLLARTLGRFFWAMYDHLGRLVLANLCATLLAVSPLALWAAGLFPIGIAGLCSFALWAIFQTALTAFALEMRRFSDPSFAAFWSMARRWAFTGLKAHALCGAALVVLGVNVVFWAKIPSESKAIRLFGKGMSGFCIWGTILVLLSYLYLIPLLIDGKGGIFGAAKRALLLALDNPGPSVGAAAVLVLVESAALASMGGFLVIGLAAVSVMSATLYTTVIPKYKRIAERNAVKEQAADWRPGRQSDPTALDVDGEPVRSLRELWRPWE